MKKYYLSVAVVCALAGSMMMSSCIGSFTLSNKLLTWNKTVGSKFVNELVFFAFWVLPVYEVSILADVLVLNSIEFWSGENPVASTQTKTIQGKDGLYLVCRDATGYTITNSTTQESCRLNYDKNANSWNVVMPDGSEKTIMTFVDNKHVALPTPDGGQVVVEVSEAGVLAYQEVATGALFAAI